MQTYDFAPKLARVLTEYCRPVGDGDYVLINGSTTATPLVEALFAAVLDRGGLPTVMLGLPGLLNGYVRHIHTDAQYTFIDPGTRARYEQADMIFTIMAPNNTKELSRVPVDKLQRFQQGRRELTELYLGRCADDSLRWNITAWPTEAAAQEAEMSLTDYTEFMYRACGLDQDDPVAYWTALRDRQATLVAWLAGKQCAEVKGPGVDLTFDFGGRSWVNSHGVKNFPDGEVFTSPIEDTMNGRIEFSYPTNYMGRSAEGVKLTFKDGVVVEASAEKGEDLLLSQLDMDEGARRVGEFAVGTNTGIKEFTGGILFDEKIGGTIHLALGEGIAESGGVNKSAIHWDIVHGMQDGGEIWIDGTLFYKDGEFQVG
ncbi:MAG: aminopeptidase [Anaerolineae bacterium]|nr:aminopeptidase [Anaerolineae bacterium]